jgi:hypothetical protein
MFFFKKNIYRILTIFFLFVFVFVLSKSALAEVYTVGTDGTYTTIQSAIDAAIVSPGYDEIRVRPGIYSENIFIRSNSINIGTLNITGGWNNTFSTRDSDYTLTTIDGSATSRIFNIFVESTGSLNLIIDGFTLQNGIHSTYGSGINISSSGTGNAQIEINNNRIVNNVSSGSNSSRGGGIRAYMNTTGMAVLNITNNLIKENSIASTADSCAGAGIDLYLFESAVFNITGNIIEDNSSTTNFSSDGVGINIQKYGLGTCDISNNIVRNNSAYGTGDRKGIGSYLYIIDSATITLSGNQWLNNVNSGGNACGDVQISTLSTSTVIIKDSLIAGAVDHGLAWGGHATSGIHMTNLTITDNGDYGLKSGSPDIASLYNTIIYNNGTNYDTLPGDTGNNIIGSDPEFVSPAGQDYHLRPGSPAINAGTNSPTGGLGSLDLDGNTRIMQSTVDIGAYEFKPASNPGVMLLLLN